MTDSFTPLSLDTVCRVEFGPGRIGLLPELIADTGHHRAFVVTDRGLRAAGVAERVLKILDVAGVEYAVYDEVAPNPSTALPAAVTLRATSSRRRSRGPARIRDPGYPVCCFARTNASMARGRFFRGVWPPT